VHAADGGLEVVGGVDAPGGLGAHAGGGLEDEGEADLGGEGVGVGGAVDEAVAGDGEVVEAELILHPRFVAEEVGDAGGGALDVHGLADLGEGDLEGLEDAEEAMDGAVVVGELVGGGEELVGAEAVLHDGDVVEEAGVGVGGGFLSDLEEVYIGQVADRADKAEGVFEGEGGGKNHVPHEKRCSMTA